MSALGRDGLARGRALGVEVGWHALAIELAQVEARHGDAQRAIERVEEVLAEQRSLGMYGLTLARTHEARARAAVWSGDRQGAQHHAMLAARESGGALAIGQAPLQDLLGDARDAGMDLSISPSQFESAVLGSASATRPTPITERVERSLGDCHDAHARAQGALELLCSLAGAAGGQLYLVSADGGLQPVASRCAPAPDADAVRFARGFFDQQLDDAQMTGAFTQVTHLESLPGVASYVDARGREHRVIPLNSRTESGLVYVGLAVLAVADAPADAAALLIEAPAVAAALLAAGDSPGARAADSHTA